MDTGIYDIIKQLVDTFVVVVFLVLIYMREKEVKKERKELLDRIQAKDLKEYKKFEETKEVVIERKIKEDDGRYVEL